MKVIDLLNKIANGEEVPKKVKYKTHYWEYKEEAKDYKDNEDDYVFSCSNYDITAMLNNEVEIIEEPQEHKIPKKICTNRIINTKDILEFEMIQNKINAEYTYVINKIIDYLKKGDKE